MKICRVKRNLSQCYEHLALAWWARWVNCPEANWNAGGDYVRCKVMAEILALKVTIK